MQIPAVAARCTVVVCGGSGESETFPYYLHKLAILAAGNGLVNLQFLQAGNRLAS